MKNTSLLLFLLLLITSSSFGQKRKLYGHWKATQIDGEVLPAKRNKKRKGLAKDLVGTWEIIGISNKADETELPKTLIQFNKDGTFWTNEGVGHQLTWRLNDEQQLILGESGREEDIVGMTLSKNKKELSLTVDGNLVTLQRHSKSIPPPSLDLGSESTLENDVEEKEPAEKGMVRVLNTDVIGTWDVIQIDEEVLDKREFILIFEETGAFSITDNGILEREGTWTLVNANMGIKLKDSRRSTSQYKIRGFEENQLIIEDSYGVFTLKKR